MKKNISRQPDFACQAAWLGQLMIKLHFAHGLATVIVHHRNGEKTGKVFSFMLPRALWING